MLTGDGQVRQGYVPLLEDLKGNPVAEVFVKLCVEYHDDEDEFIPDFLVGIIDQVPIIDTAAIPEYSLPLGMPN